MSRWLITGAGGMLGRDLTAAAEGSGENVTALTRSDLDITDETAVREAVRCHRPDVVVNCAAWTAVDAAEAHEREALKVNGQGVVHLATACADSGARLVQMSTDYVFRGNASRPYAESDEVGPRTAYGRGKLAGEQAVLSLLPTTGYVVRTAWLYGAHGPNFVRTMIRLERDQPTVDVVDDQRGQPTWTADVSGQVIALARSHAPAGVYHATSAGNTTWFGLAREVFRLLGADETRVRPIDSGDYPRPAPRPAYSVLSHGAWARAGIRPIRHWRHALRSAFPTLSS